jgi:hypothetical protein
VIARLSKFNERERQIETAMLEAASASNLKELGYGG